jgi:hypothetical protein
MDFLKTFGPVIGQIAPSIATALGGPLAGTAVSYLSQVFFGHGNASAQELSEAMQSASPDQLAALKQIDADFKAKMAQVGVDLQKIAVEDRKSARDMQKETKDWIPRALAICVTIGFFGILIYMLIFGLPTTGNEALLLLLGALQTAWMGIIAFYFGASQSDMTKDKMIYNSTPKDQ